MSEEIVPSSLDEHFAELIATLEPHAPPELRAAALLVSAWRGAGHTCVPAEALGGAEVISTLRECRIVGAPGEFKPLIVDGSGRLYLQRYWAYEAQLAASIRQRLTRMPCKEDALQRGLDRYFPDASEADGQRCAAESAVRNQLTVITGGPGTGKTSTVAVILALLVDQFAQIEQVPRVALAAPTGKAAMRMRESLGAALARVPAADSVLPHLPAEATTLHRLLGTIPNSPFFRHDPERPLSVDVVIVDEASMIDVALMAKLFAALPPSARVILLGDKDQLASVEAGNVLGDICGLATARRAEAPLASHIVELRRNYRFAASSGIHRLSQFVNAGDADAAVALLDEGSRSDVIFGRTPSPAQLANELRSRVLDGYRAFLHADAPADVLARLVDFRILSALRRGPFGVENLNRHAEQLLTHQGWIAPNAPHYHGRPLLILENDYALGLFNGDVGVILRDPESDGDLRAFFLDASAGLRRLLPARLPPHETSFAMTVHKSQGSEFDRVLLILPDRDNAVATRELLYTGLTRARSSVELWASPEMLRTTIARRTLRSSGLREALWEEQGA